MSGKHEALATSVGKLLDEKEIQYGDAFERSGSFLALLYPSGLKPEDYLHALTLVRMWDKMCRIASPNRRTDQENPYVDMAGYALLGQQLWNPKNESDSPVLDS